MIFLFGESLLSLSRAKIGYPDKNGINNSHRCSFSPSSRLCDDLHLHHPASIMKSIRKSLNANKDSVRNNISTPMLLPAVSKPASAILPPQKVIRATADYRPQAPQELSFKKGDFFYVIKDVNDQGSWYEAHNPVSGARGLVPRALFEEFNKSSSCVLC